MRQTSLALLILHHGEAIIEPADSMVRIRFELSGSLRSAWRLGLWTHPFIGRYSSNSWRPGLNPAHQNALPAIGQGS